MEEIGKKIDRVYALRQTNEGFGEAAVLLREVMAEIAELPDGVERTALALRAGYNARIMTRDGGGYGALINLHLLAAEQYRSPPATRETDTSYAIEAFLATVSAFNNAVVRGDELGHTFNRLAAAAAVAQQALAGDESPRALEWVEGNIPAHVVEASMLANINQYQGRSSYLAAMQAMEAADNRYHDLFRPFWMMAQVARLYDAGDFTSAIEIAEATALTGEYGDAIGTALLFAAKAQLRLDNPAGAFQTLNRVVRMQTKGGNMCRALALRALLDLQIF